jgi:hypothetical protein
MQVKMGFVVLQYYGMQSCTDISNSVGENSKKDDGTTETHFKALSSKSNTFLKL